MQMTSVHAHTVSFDVQETKYKKSQQSQDKHAEVKNWDAVTKIAVSPLMLTDVSAF